MERRPARPGALAPQDAAYEALRARSAHEVIDERFASAQARDLLTWLSFATITDVRRPGTGILPFSITSGRAQFGWATPIGGSGALPEALVRSIESHGGRVLTGRPVERILVRGGRAAGVVTADGRRGRPGARCCRRPTSRQLAGMLDGIEPPAELRVGRRHLAAGAHPVRRPPGHRGRTSPTRPPRGRCGRWPAGSARRPACRRSSTPSLGARPDAEDPWVLVVCSTVVDPDRAPDGRGLVKLLTFAPRELAGGRSWDVERRPVRRRRSSRGRPRGSRPGVLESVLAVRGEAPVGLEARNRHNVGGSCHGGRVPAAVGGGLVGWP